MTYDLWNSNTHRWHASRCHALRNSGDDTDAHAARCYRLLISINPTASVYLRDAVALHDVAERVTGDTPWGAKFASEDLRSVLVFLETLENKRLGISHIFEALTPDEWDWVKLADRLDAYLWCAQVAPAELTRDDWQDAFADILHRANMLGVFEAVTNLIGAKAA